MKKFLSVFICFILGLSVFSFVGCTATCTCPPSVKTEPILTGVKLTLDNYTEYLTVNKIIRGKQNHVYVGVELEFQNGWYPARETWVSLDLAGNAETEYEVVINVKGYIIILEE